MSKTIPKDSEAALEEARKLLCDFFDCGIIVVSWEEEGTTFSGWAKFGNDYAIASIKDNIHDIMGPDEEEQAEEAEV